MKIKQITGLYFSPTDTTKKIVSYLAEQLSDTLACPCRIESFNLPSERIERQFDSDTLVILGIPVYAGRVPNVLLPYLKESIRGENTLAVPVVLYGNRNFDDALIELRDIMEENGFRTISAGAFVGEHSFSKKLAAGRPDSIDMQMASRFANRIATKILHMQEVPDHPVTVRGETPIRPYYRPKDAEGKPIDIRKVKPKTRDTCTHCGLCAALCPMGSINPEDPSEINGICIKCCACEKHCPVNAKYFDDPGYLYHKVSLEKNYTARAETYFYYN